jgi:carboxyl-terminal processing protease
MRNRERALWIGLTLALLLAVTASGLRNRIFAGDTEKTFENMRLFNEIFNLLRTEYYDETKVTSDKLTHGAIEGMVRSLDDPHTAYMEKDLFNELQTDTKGEFGGLGIVIGVRDDWITIISPIDDTPAAMVGVKAGDRIVEIDGKSTEGYSTEEAVKLLRGRVGTSVTITIERESAADRVKFTIVRGLIKLETVKSSMIESHIGYIRISQFSEPTAEVLKKQLDSLRSKGMDSLIVDLRNNPGGLLSSAIEISDMFIDRGTIVSTKGRNKSQNQVFTSHGKSLVPDLPLIVLVNEGSASASEIFAGAIKDNKRGVLVGMKTFGKGSVQSVKGLPDGSGIRITTALYYTPSGVSIDKTGIEPDETVKEVEVTKEETAAIDKINELSLIQEFVKAHKTYTEKEFDGFMRQLSQRDLKVKPVIVRRLIRNEQEKREVPSLIDLDYDLQLRHAVNMLKTANLLLRQKAG